VLYKGCVKFWTASRHQQDLGKLAVTYSMLVLWLASFALAASPQLHRLLHQDAHNLNHHCLITQIKQQDLAAGCPVALEASPLLDSFGLVAALDEQCISSFDFRVSFGRGPPSFSSSKAVVG